MSAYPHVIAQLPTINISLVRSNRNLFHSLGSTPTAGLRETQTHTRGEAHSLCLVAQESDIHISQHQI